MTDEALAVATDPDYRFELAIQLGKLELVKKKEGIPWRQYILIIDGKILEDGKTLADHHVQNGSRLELVVSLGGDTMPIFVKTLTGKTIKLEVESSKNIDAVNLEVESSNSLRYVMEMIEEKEGIPVNQVF
ncbi:unnamed protein product [Lactuca saligna]|uniref:Ubiquitin-like domain-containing protein n=1 Tax=Lactuca saligna TaxID=75948 RepID=A0AA35VQN0_LACSI|nr:unnamed protein product [Lactuca saligna]